MESFYMLTAWWIWEGNLMGEYIGFTHKVLHGGQKKGNVPFPFKENQGYLLSIFKKIGFVFCQILRMLHLPHWVQ